VELFNNCFQEYLPFLCAHIGKRVVYIFVNNFSFVFGTFRSS
jgi:hypothetical protein